MATSHKISDRHQKVHNVTSKDLKLIQTNLFRHDKIFKANIHCLHNAYVSVEINKLKYIK